MAFVCDQDGGPPLDSDLDQGAGEEVKARQVDPGGWRSCGARVQFCSMKDLNSNICVMIGGRVSIGKKPLTSRCRPDEMKSRFDCCIQN